MLTRDELFLLQLLGACVITCFTLLECFFFAEDLEYGKEEYGFQEQVFESCYTGVGEERGIWVIQEFTQHLSKKIKNMDTIAHKTTGGNSRYCVKEIKNLI